MIKKVFKELKEHIPFTFLAVIFSIGTVIVLKYLFKIEFNKEFFHFFHFLHIIASSMVTGALYYKYKKEFLSSFFVGVSGALIIGSLSDIIFPYLGGILMNLDIHFHLPLLEKTFPVLFFSFTGSLIGIKIGMTKFPHFIHVFISVFASLFYLLVFSELFTPLYFINSFLIVFIAVIIPCCISDIIYPLIFTGKNKH